MLGRIPRPLGLLLAVAALLSIAWTFTTAPLQGPDEPAHSNYTQYLAETGHRPSVSSGQSPDSTQTGTALIFMNLQQLAGDTEARPPWSQLEDRRFDDIMKAFGERAERDGSGPNPLAKNPPLYYAYEAIAYRIGSLGSYWDRLIVMRLASGVLFVLTVAFAWLAAAELFRGTWPRLVAAGATALLPQLTFLSGTVNADNLLVAVWSAFAFAALRLARRGPNLTRTVAVCGIACLSLLTHGRGAAILLPLLCVLAVAFLRARPPLRRTLGWLGAGLGLLAATALLYRLALTPSGGAYGGEVTLARPGFDVRQLLSWTWQFYFPAPGFLDARPGPSYGYRQMFIESFFGRFASLEVAFPKAVYDLIQTCCAIGIAALLALVATHWQPVRDRWAQLIVLVSMTVGMLALLHTASYRALLTGVDPLITGRYLLPLVVVFGCAIAFVVRCLPSRAGAVVGTLVLSSLLALNLAGLVLTLTRFYG